MTAGGAAPGGAPGAADALATGDTPAAGVPIPDGWVRAEIAASSSCGPVREINEDRLGWAVLGAPGSARSPRGDGGTVRAELRGPGLAVIVADGLGGHSHGERASKTAVRLLLERLVEPGVTERVPMALREGFEDANAALLEGRLDTSLDLDPAGRDTAGHAAGDAGGMPIGSSAEAATSRAAGEPTVARAHGGQTTLTALAITCRGSQLAHVGDCRVFRLRDDMLELLTTDHTQVAELLRMRLIRPEQVARHPGRHLLTRSIGGDLMLRVEARSGQPMAGDAYLLCTDGLWSAVTSSEVRGALEGDLAAGIADLVARSGERGGEDNASVIGLRLLELAGPPDATPRSGLRLPWRRGGGA